MRSNIRDGARRSASAWRSGGARNVGCHVGLVLSRGWWGRGRSGTLECMPRRDDSWLRFQIGRPLDGPATQRLRTAILDRLRREGTVTEGVTVEELWKVAEEGPRVTAADVECLASRERIAERPWGWQLSISSGAPGGAVTMGGGTGHLVDARRAEVHAYSSNPGDIMTLTTLDSVEAFERFRVARATPRASSAGVSAQVRDGRAEAAS